MRKFKVWIERFKPRRIFPEANGGGGYGDSAATGYSELIIPIIVIETINTQKRKYDESNTSYLDILSLAEVGNTFLTNTDEGS